MTAEDAIDPHFWAALPWYGRYTGYRLGVAPQHKPQWLPAIDVPMAAHKRDVLLHQYAEAVAVQPADAQPCLASLLSARDASDKYPHEIANLAMTTQADLCVLDLTQQNRLIAGCLCAPSYWRLADKIGLPLRQVHAPVTGLNQALGERIDQFLQGLPVASVFSRRNWFVHGDAHWFHLAAEPPLRTPCKDWFVRSEYQSFFRLDERYLLFSILVQCEPLRHLSMLPKAVEGLSNTLARMTPEQIVHFGGADKYARLSEYVGQLDRSSGVLHQ